MGAGNVYRHESDNVAEAIVWGTVQQNLVPRALRGKRFEPMTELAFRDRGGLASRPFRGHDEAAAERRECGFELFEADSVVAVEDMGNLLRGPAQFLGQLRRVEPGLARHSSRPRAVVRFDPDIAALAALRNNRSAETAKSAEELITRHG
jgi:hypothetical protein